MVERRAHERRRLQRNVRAIRADGVQLTCELADISRSGVRLTAQDAAALPEEFVLVIDDIQRRCRVVSRDGQSVRCVFTGKGF